MENERMEIKCPYCHNVFIAIFINESSHLFVCANCKDLVVVKRDRTVCRVVPVIPDLTREIPPIDYERLLTPFDYELASVARVKL